MAQVFFSPFAVEGILIFLALAWTLPWKGVALWKAAKRGEKWWFIVLLLVNTMAILEIAYIFYFSRRGETKEY